MISIVCVYNDQVVLGKRLLKSLATQSVQHELILLDNTESVYASASTALNEGARRSKGDWVLFAHQDIEFLSPFWLRDAEALLEAFQPMGWVGVAGVTVDGLSRGFLIDRDCLLGVPNEGLSLVQTMDECVLIHRRLPESSQYFDPSLSGWHAYGVEACVRNVADGGSNYVLHLPTWHDSKSLNLKGLEAAHSYVWNKYKAKVPIIATTCGSLPEEYSWEMIAESKSAGFVDRVLHKVLMETGFTVRNARSLGDIVEDFTRDLDEVHVLHGRASTEDLETRGFIPTTTRRRRVTHHFSGAGIDLGQFANVVVMPDVARQLMRERDLSHHFAGQSFVLVCVALKDLWWRPEFLSVLRRTRSHGVVNVPVRAYDERARHVFTFVLKGTTGSQRSVGTSKEVTRTVNA